MKDDFWRRLQEKALAMLPRGHWNSKAVLDLAFSYPAGGQWLQDSS